MGNREQTNKRLGTASKKLGTCTANEKRETAPKWKTGNNQVSTGYNQHLGTTDKNSGDPIPKTVNGQQGANGEQTNKRLGTTNQKLGIANRKQGTASRHNQVPTGN
ncbi:hypothetical protein B0H13DRAFT_1855971 [Mycena leptocephala]|nr:hypothetical protein B0H13DRAFT_1855971 [Mycena leptocephala]